MAMWGGRFATGPDQLFRAVNDSLPFDWRLVHEDLTGSIAWANALSRAGAITADEANRLTHALDNLRQTTDPLAPPPQDTEAEDVHSWVEQQLVSTLGDLGKKLHTGRSRNDQVATDLRLWTRNAIDTRLTEIQSTQRALVTLAERDADTPFPGYTHLQRAQPVTFGHWCLAYTEMLQRDADRLTDTRKRLNRCPLGAAALAGTAYPIDRRALAQDLAFDAPTANSLDAVADRDFVLDTLHAAATCALHLSRLAEEAILYTTDEFGFFKLEDAVTSGSSIMPQKKNPDAFELIRGKAGRILAAPVALGVTLKGLPLAYNKDLQEDKEPLFDAMDQLGLCLRITTRALEGLDLDRDRCRASAAGGYANATELADAMAEAGIPFREAHERVGRAVRLAIEKQLPLEDLPLSDIRELWPEADESIYQRLKLESTLDKRTVEGGTAPARVREQVLAWQNRLNNPATTAPANDRNTPAT